jgi:lipopolysaccharide export system ATP-binding protein
MREGEILAYGDREQLAANDEVRRYYLGKNFQF